MKQKNNDLRAELNRLCYTTLPDLIALWWLMAINLGLLLVILFITDQTPLAILVVLFLDTLTAFVLLLRILICNYRKRLESES